MTDTTTETRGRPYSETIIGAGFALAVIALLVVSHRGGWFSSQAQMPENLPPTPPPPCLLAVTATSATAYNRPSFDSSIFGTMTLNEVAFAVGRTKEGWIGFEPAVAQAPNVGLLRLRWLPPETPISFSPGCPNGPEEVPTLEADACYGMTHGQATVRTAPNSEAPVAGILSEGFMRLESRFDGYLEVEGVLGGSEPSLFGWISADEVELNGMCDFVSA